MFSKQLLDEMGLLNLKHKHSISVDVANIDNDTENETAALNPQSEERSDNHSEEQAGTNQQTNLDKNEFRLLVKMLQAIDHDCVYDNISYDGKFATYKLPKRTLVFKDINLPDDDITMNLCSLSDLITNPKLKRPVWEKLKTL